VTAVKVIELEEAQSRLGVANFQRIETAGQERPGRRWWEPGGVSKFYVSEGEGRARERGIWENVRGCIGKYGAGPVSRSPGHQGPVNLRKP
jgi:hypothetical protein